MRVLQKLLILCLICSIGAYAQQTTRAPKTTAHQRHAAVRVVSIRFVIGAGLCDCYCASEIRVTVKQATLFKTPFHDCQQQNPEKYREFKVTADLSSKHWHELEELVNHDALFALPDKIGCPGCADGLTQFLEVEFSDRTKKSVYYENPPSQIAPLSQKLFALQEKLERELPPNWINK